MNKVKISLLVCVLVSQICVAQQAKNDSITQGVIAYLAGKFAAARPLNVEYTHTFPHDYSQGEANRFSQVYASSTFSFIKKPKWVLGATLEYRYQNLDADYTDETSGISTSINDEFHYHQSSLNFLYFSKLFNKMVIYSANVSVDGSDKHFERIKGMAGATLLLKADARTKMAVGLIANIDPSVQFPVIPVFTYERKLDNGYAFDMTLPQRLYIRKYFPKKSRISIGSELNKGADFYVYNLNPANPKQKFEYRQIDLYNGLVYERLLGDNFILTAKTGMRVAIGSGLFDKEESLGDAEIETKPKPAFYANVGLSFNPFIKKKK
ncbi:hypothetical protein [Sphingobacterium siyangense]|uniref:Outer membrane protein with beta-barrel domain n=1 Tax=Sphingobacterium siyangense TaxID=459529 RepID=A0A562MFY9_9SPHI|nr:hypothetical protein [Sphingobacterium siyangense]TWI18810.1 hypothetical protein IQ31_02938 [Sphingobacterium siyangense]